VRKELERLAQRITDLLDTLNASESPPKGRAVSPTELPPAPKPPSSWKRIVDWIETHKTTTGLIVGILGLLGALWGGDNIFVGYPTPPDTPTTALSTPSPPISCPYDGADAASYYHEQGTQAREQGNRTQAITAFECALQADPEQAATMYQLARTYEDKGDTERADNYYQQAANRGYAPAANEMLYRLLVTTIAGDALSEEQHNEAERYDSYLQEALDRDDDISPEEQFFFYKNRGWHAFVRGSTMFDVALHQLDQAIDLFEARRARADVGNQAFDTLPRASPYCLRAQIYQQQGRAEEAIDEAWRACCRWANTKRNEEAVWRSQGQAYFAEKGESCLFSE
jgi:predicted Zn-dependent protease